MASAFSGIFSRSFSSCLDLERVMPAGGAGGGSSRCKHGMELSPCPPPPTPHWRVRSGLACSPVLAKI